MRSSNLTLGAVLNSPNQYVIPVFQRYYRWDQPEWETLWDDLAELQQHGRTGRHFMGFLVLVPESVMPGQIAKYHLIDGQQRLTTLSLVLCALREVAAAAGLAELAQEVALTTLEHQFRKGTDRYRLFPKLRDRDQYISCLAGQPPAEGRLGGAMRYFAGRLAAIPGARTESGLRAVFDTLTQRLEFVYAQLEGENPFHIFKSLNSTGVPLGQSDLIRNFAFMQVPVGDQDEFDEALWKPIERHFEDGRGNIDEVAFSAFLRDYLMRDGRYVPPGATFEAFQRHFEATEFDPEQVAADLKQAAGWYATLLGQRPDPNPEVEAALEGLRQLDSSTTLTLLLHLYGRRHRGRLGDRDLAEAVQLLSGFILRRLVCGESSRAYARMFVQAIPSLGNDAVEGLRRFLEARGFPDTPRFVTAFARFNLYGSRYRKAVLEAMERAYEHKEPVMLDDAQVEHVMPQTLSEPWRAALGPEYERIHTTWLHTPGNLTLTGYNAELHNKPFAAKRQEYRGSNIVMTRELADSEAWGEPEIERRGRAMAEVAARVWPGPAAPVRRAEEEAKATPTRFETRLRYWEGFREQLQAAGSALRPGKPQPHYSLGCGRLAPGVGLYAYLNLRNERLAVSAYFHGAGPLRLYHDLREHRDAIETEVGSKLVWSHGPARKSGEIVLRNPVDLTNAALWPSYYDWMRRSLETLQRVLSPRIAKLFSTEEAEAPATPSATLTLQVEYWTALRDRLVAGRSPLTPQKPAPRHWTSYAIGRKGFHLSATMLKTAREIGVYLVLGGPRAAVHFQQLLEERAAIEQELGTELEWQELPGKKGSYVVLRRQGVDPNDHEDWASQHAWLQEKLEAFHKVFGPRVKELSAEDSSPEPTP
jgi:hypothetical protein